MDLIKSAAYFALCECGKHGCVVCADGTESEHFFTISSGMRELTELMLADKVEDDEMKEAKRQIEESGLPRRNTDVEALMEELIDKDQVTEMLELLHSQGRPAVVQATHDARNSRGTKNSKNAKRPLQ